MESRRFKRKKVHIKAELIVEGENYPGFIENVSGRGINLGTDSVDLLSTSSRFNPGTECEVKFQIPSGEEIKLHCKVIWSYKAAPHGLTKRIGMEVIFPPPSYVEFCKTP